MSYPFVSSPATFPAVPSTMAASESAKPMSKTSKKSRKSVSKSTSKSGSPSRVSKKQSGNHRRSRSGMAALTFLYKYMYWSLMIYFLGCFTCRLRRKKCDEAQPICKACKNLKLRCEYEQPDWWGDNNEQKSQKNRLKDLIKATKRNEKEEAHAQKNCCGYKPPPLTRTSTTPETTTESASGSREASPEPVHCFDKEFNQLYQDSYDSHKPLVQSPTSLLSSSAPYEVDIKTETELFINDVPTRRDSSTSSFNTFQPPLAHTMLPSFVGDDWVHREIFEQESIAIKDPPSPPSFGFSQPVVGVPNVHIEDSDRYLLDYFIENVSRLIFPMLEVRQQGRAFSEVILPAIESNKSYLHCCLSMAAVHLKATEHITSDRIDNDIMKHRFQAVSELCKSLGDDLEHHEILEGTLGMTLFPCSVGRADDTLQDIAWHHHFEAATGLINKLELPRRLLESDHGNVHPPFSMSLSAWIDILGSTMLGKMPQFAHTYRTKLLGGSNSGLSELMGCDDRVMYLIAEISCLDALNLEGRIDHLALCGHITNLAQQLDYTEPPEGALVKPFFEDGTVQPQQLSKNMTALFRVAARVYLCSLVPGFQCSQQSAMSLISYAADLLDLIPAGPQGFDRSLVWPLLICGSFSTRNSSFRTVLSSRLEKLGEQAEFGSFGRMVRLVQEVWRLSDVSPSSVDIPTSATMTSTPPQNVGLGGTPRLPTPVSKAPSPERGHLPSQELQAQACQQVHWRDVMKRNGWDFLLI